MKKWHTGRLTCGPMGGISLGEALCKFANDNGLGAGEIQILHYDIGSGDFHFSHLNFLYFSEKEIKIEN